MGNKVEAPCLPVHHVDATRINAIHLQGDLQQPGHGLRQVILCTERHGYFLTDGKILGGFDEGTHGTDIDDVAFKSTVFYSAFYRDRTNLAGIFPHK